MNPYITNQDPQKLFATTQGTGLQDQFNAQALQQMAQLANQSGQYQAPKSQAMSLADMLRNKPTSNTDFLNQGYNSPSLDGLNPNSNDWGYNFNLSNSYGIKP